MPTQPSEKYSAFRDAHAALESAQQHVRDLQAALEEMRTNLEKTKAKLEERQREDATFLANAMTAKASPDKCVRCGLGIGDGAWPMCQRCADVSRRAVEAVSLASASISGTTANLEGAKSEASAAQAVETKAFEAWAKSEHDVACEKLISTLTKAFDLAARVDALAYAGRQRAHGVRGAWTGIPDLPGRIEAAITTASRGGTPKDGKKMRASLAAVLHRENEKTSAECFGKIPTTSRPGPTMHREAETARLGELHVLSSRGDGR